MIGLVNLYLDHDMTMIDDTKKHWNPNRLCDDENTSSRYCKLSVMSTYLSKSA